MTNALFHADSKYIWMNGERLPYAEAQVPVLAHSLHYGTAAFEGIRAYRTASGSAIFRAKEHYDRLADSFRILGGELPYSSEQLIQASQELMVANGFRDCYLRPIAFLDDQSRGLKLPKTVKAHVAIASWEWGAYLGDGAKTKGIRAAVSSYRRANVGSSMPFAKLSGGYLTSVLARREASLAGFDEALMLDTEGYVAEGSGENIFLIKDGEICTPPVGSILPGITRASVIELVKSLGFPFTERRITRNELYLADELFFTGTAVEVTPIREVDHHPIGEGQPGPITKRLGDLFFRCVSGEEKAYQRWLTPVPA